MDLFGSDGIHLALRWFHVVAVITWIGHALFFNWLDRNLRPVEGRREGESIEGELWMVHSGGFYRVEKISVAPARLPPELHWFKWEAALSWLSGFLLLTVTYYHSGALLMRPGSELSVWAASGIGIGTLVLGWFVYDGLWASAFGRWRLAPVVGWALIGATAYGLSQVLSGRAAYIHVGSLLGTIMVVNVWRRIIPAQDALLAATRAGTTPDPSLGKRAKGRSIHNNYLMLPVVFIMVSNHFWGTYGHQHAWAILVLLGLAGVGLRHMLNERLSRRPLHVGALALMLAALVGAWWVMRPAAPEDDGDEVAVVRPVLPASGAGAGGTGASGADAGQGDAAGAGAGDAADTAGALGAGAAAGGASGAASSGGAANVMPAAPGGLGTIRGTVHLEGDPGPSPQLELLSECRGLHSGPVLKSDILVRDGLLQNAFVRLVDGLNGVDVPPAPDAPVVIDQRGCLYSPRVVGVRVKQDLRFLNSDPVLHNIHATPKRNREFNIGQPAGANPADRSFRKQEAMIAVRCDVHPWMAAFVGVVDHPWFAVTDADGAFELTDVPAGRYTAEVWHEVFGTQQAEVTVQADGTAELSFRYH